jgi:signal transduction histidine kinase
VTESTRSYSVRVDSLLLRVRWVLWLLVLPIVWIDSNGAPFPDKFWIWMGTVAVTNLLIGTMLITLPRLPRILPIGTLVFDTISFGILPYLVDSNFNLLSLLLIFPTLVGAVRFGPQVSLVTASSLSLSIGARTLIPNQSLAQPGLLSALPPIIAIFAAAFITGFLSEREKEAAIKQAASELDELRGAIAGARLLYQSTDTLNLSTSYKPVLEAMLEAGVKGLPATRREDGMPIGFALFFDDTDPQQQLVVVAARNIQRHDYKIRIPGKEGIVAETLKTGNAVVFDAVNKDPELSTFGTLSRCRSGVCYPLQAGLEQYGVVILASPAPRPPTRQHLELMHAFTSQAGIAFQNAKLYQLSRIEQDKIIRSETDMRQKLARDLHDGPTQKIAGLAMQLDYIRRLIDKDPAEAKLEIEKAHAVAQQTVKEIRNALFTLRPLSLETKGLSAALEQFAERLKSVDNLDIHLETEHFGNELEQNVAMTVFAIIEEAVGNARKHAGQSPIFVSAIRKGQSLVASIQDQGPGFDLEQVKHSYDERTSLGLQNMYDRAKLIDSNLIIDSAPGYGTRVSLIVPLAQPQSNETIQ